MIFSLQDHIEQIKAGTKTQTRRPSDRYKVNKVYAIQPGRGKKGIPDGKIFIVAKRMEVKSSYIPWKKIIDNDISNYVPAYYILQSEAHDEGGYTPREYEKLYEKLYPNWKIRYAYLFRYFPTEILEHLDKGEINEAFEKWNLIRNASV
jgi:hypothetical protein